MIGPIRLISQAAEPLIPVVSTDNTIKNALSLVFLLMGGVALVLVTLAGLKFVLARGNPDEVAKARNQIIYALIGLAVALAAYSIVNFVVDNL